MKHSSALATLRELDELNLPGRAVLTEVNAVLREVIGYDSVCFSWTDGQCNIADVTFLSSRELEEAAHRYALAYANQREQQYIRSLKDLMVSGSPFDSSDQYGRAYLGSDLYREVNSPAGMHQFMRVPVMDGVRPIGCLSFGRPYGSRKFSDKSKAFVRQAAGVVSHVLSRGNTPIPMDGDECGEHGSLICDMRGNVEHFDITARRLLSLATNTSIYSARPGQPFMWATTLLLALIRKVTSSSALNEVPLIRLQNESGVYQLRAYRFFSAAGGEPNRIHVQVSRLIPRRLTFLQSPLVKALPPREKQVCLLLLQGMPTSDIAKKLGISAHGVAHHLRNLYTRIGISQREDLYPLILGSVKNP